MGKLENVKFLMRKRMKRRRRRRRRKKEFAVKYWGNGDLEK
jgi:hypothetical protein